MKFQMDFRAVHTRRRLHTTLAGMEKPHVRYSILMDVLASIFSGVVQDIHASAEGYPNTKSRNELDQDVAQSTISYLALWAYPLAPKLKKGSGFAIALKSLYAPRAKTTLEGYH